MKPGKFNQPPSQTLFENRLSEKDPKAAEISTAVRSMVKKSRHAQANLTLFEDSINIPNDLLPDVRGKIYEVLGSDADRYVLRPEGYRLVLEAKGAVAHGAVPKVADVVPIKGVAPQGKPVSEPENEKDMDPEEQRAKEWAEHRLKKRRGY